MAYSDYLSLIRRKKALGLPVTQQETSQLAYPSLKAEAIANIETGYRGGLLDLDRQKIAMQKEAYEREADLVERQAKAAGTPSLTDYVAGAKMTSDIYGSKGGQALLSKVGLIDKAAATGKTATGATGLIEAGGTATGLGTTATGATGATAQVGVGGTASGQAAINSAIAAKEAAIAGTTSLEVGGGTAATGLGTTTTTTGGASAGGTSALGAAGYGAAAGFVGGTVAKWITKAGQPGHMGGERLTGGALGGAFGVGLALLMIPGIGWIGAGIAFIVGAFTGSGGSVICTELNRRGYLSDRILELDTIYGMIYLDHYTYAGYRKLADPVVRLMQTSEFFTKWIVRPIALAWCFEVAHRMRPEEYRGNIIGKVMLKTCVPICRWLGKFTSKSEVAYAIN